MEKLIELVKKAFARPEVKEITHTWSEQYTNGGLGFCVLGGAVYEATGEILGFSQNIYQTLSEITGIDVETLEHISNSHKNGKITAANFETKLPNLL